MQCQVTIVTDCRALTFCMHLSYIVSHEQESGLVLAYRVYSADMTYLHGSVKCSVLYEVYKRERLQSTICECYSWEIALNVGLGVSFDNM
jgi:hypothetical protein